MFDLTSDDAIARLGNNGPAGREKRRVIRNNFRHITVDGKSAVPWPWLYGDAMSVPPADTPRQNASLSDYQLWALDKWAEGDFNSDYDPACEPPRSIDDVPLREQGDMLTKAAMDFCLADAFHPGCEMTWPVRSKTMYMAPFRFKHVRDGWIDPPLGALLSSDNVTMPDGPLYGQQPGSITRWMAVPWQTDTASCKSGYLKTNDPYVPSFWPARVPNTVLTKQNYAILMDSSKSMSERKAAFANRAEWTEPLGAGSYTDGINNMILYFDQLGVVEAHEGPTDTNELPSYIEVEDEHILVTAAEEKDERSLQSKEKIAMEEQVVPTGPATIRGRGLAGTADWDLANIEKVNRFPRGLR